LTQEGDALDDVCKQIIDEWTRHCNRAVKRGGDGEPGCSSDIRDGQHPDEDVTLRQQ